ncbi:EAL domain-containing protein [Cohnella boryungensis]|uniref:EAL domain-containing protein n=1 Tax=Cohnella boryungensis TaxID=768479 RepID=A0ABV8SEP3_9BACL
MSTSWFGIGQLNDRIDRHSSIGIIAIDLNEWGGKRAPGLRTEGIDWTTWLSESMKLADLWYADEIAGHLWLYAAMPPALGEEESDGYLRGLARRVREALAASSAGELAGWRESPNRERGIGYARLKGLQTNSLKEAVYEGMLKATALIRDSWIAHPDRELRFELNRLIAESGIRSVYQPIVRLRDGRIFGYEALTRCPENSLFDGPLALFQFAERSNMALALDRLARETAIRHSPELAPVQKIFINVTMSIINDPHFVSGQTVHWLRERGLIPEQVVFELTERSSIDDFPAAKKILAHYRSQGYEIAIDDAGAGYSSLQSIVELNPDYIKIDRSLVRMADKDEMKEHMLRTFVGFAQKMNIRTVAEGIERQEELHLLRAMGFDYAQGYLIGRPSEHPITASPGVTPKA